MLTRRILTAIAGASLTGCNLVLGAGDYKVGPLNGGSGGASTSSDAATTGAVSSTAATTVAAATSSTAAASTSGATSSTSTGTPAHCGGTSVLADDFSGTPDPSWVWSTNAWGNGAISETGGTLTATFPNGQNGLAWASFITNRHYDLTSDALSIEVVNAGNTATTERAFFGLGRDDPTFPHAHIVQESGVLSAIVAPGDGSSATLGATAYDPVKDLYWRIRENAGTTYFETSPDGTAWTAFAQGSIAAAFPTNRGDIEIGGTAGGGVVNPSALQFAKLNVAGVTPGSWCPVASITDDFQSATRSSNWSSFTQGTTTVAQGNGTLTFTLGANETAVSAYVSVQSYNLVGSAVVVHVPTVPNTAATHSQVIIALEGAGNTQVKMSETAGFLGESYGHAGMNSDAQQTYDPTADAWWRIRESGGTVYWETSPDGKTWTPRNVVPSSVLGFPLTAFDLYLYGITYAPDANPGACSFAALNLPPP